MPVSRRKMVWTAAGAVSMLAATLLTGWWQVDGPAAPQRQTRISALPLPFFEMDFQLTDHSGRKVGPEDWIGSPTLVFFGFTYCPDICPTTLSDITRWLEQLGEDASRLHAVFITVDPQRDTVQAMAEYVRNFHPSIKGYTGPLDEIDKATRAFRAKYERVPTENGYTMNHTAGVFVYDADGNFAGVIDFHESRDIAVPKIRQVL